MSIKSSYTSGKSRDYYKGTSFQYSGKWNEGNHYQCDEYVIDFVSLNNVLLKCNKSHTAAEWNKPIFVKDDKGCVIGIEPNEYWQFVIVGVDKVVYTDNNYTDIDKHFLTSIPGYNEESETEADVYSTEDVDTKLANKIDKDGNKQLSDENYTSEEKTKLEQLPNKSTLDEQFANKQNKLVSGSNIKTINGNSLLGSGNLEVITDISNKADKVQNATANNIAILDATGNLKDGGKNLSDIGSSYCGSFDTWSDVPNSSPGYKKTPEKNDYIVIGDVSDCATIYDTDTQYSNGMYVFYQDKLYKAKTDNIGRVPNSNPNDWKYIKTVQGFDGAWLFVCVDSTFAGINSWEPQYGLSSNMIFEDVIEYDDPVISTITELKQLIYAGL